MNLKRYYLLGVILPALVSAIALIIVSLILLDIPRNDNISLGFVIFAKVFAPILMVSIGCLFSVTLFLNKFRLIYSNSILSFISWFLLPSLYFGSLFVNMDDASHDTGGMMEIVLILTAPNTLGLILSFIFFRQQVSKNSLEPTH